jgi:hypothetical protein
MAGDIVVLAAGIIVQTPALEPLGMYTFPVASSTIG